MLNFFREQLAAMRFAKDLAFCARRGHTEPQPIMWAGEMKLVCLNCGKDL
jgi:hypothetical protein